MEVVSYEEGIEMNCEWCGKQLEHIFAGDEVYLLGHHLFVCRRCGNLIQRLNKRKKKVNNGATDQ